MVGDAPVNADLIKSLMMPAALVFIMLGMGLSLTVSEFQRILVSPKAKLVRLFCQRLALLALAFGISLARLIAKNNCRNPRQKTGTTV
jgi:BASS family bile acid:Na+ symporter